MSVYSIFKVRFSGAVAFKIKSVSKGHRPPEECALSNMQQMFVYINFRCTRTKFPYIALNICCRQKEQRPIRNAARYLTGEAKAGSIMTTSNDNRRTYNQQSTISFAGSNFYIRDEQDAYALAVEIASLTRRQQRGRGLRMA